MNETLGARLRQQREQRQVTLAAISAQTKIKMTLLEALESDDVSQWPRGLFARAYVRDYARAIGLDPEPFVSEFLALHPEFSTAAEIEATDAVARAEAARRPAARLRRFVSAAFSIPARNAAQPREVSTGVADDPCEETAHFHSGSSPAVFAAASHVMPAELESADSTPDPVADPSPAPPPALTAHEYRADVMLSSIADLCARMARALDWRDLTMLLADAARIIDAAGVIMWQWDSQATALRPSLAYGYAPSVLARLPEVRLDASNAVATAFRSGERCVVDCANGGTEAVAVPSIGVNGCVGVLAVELRPGATERESICAVATIVAAQLAMLLPPAVMGTAVAEAVSA